MKKLLYVLVVYGAVMTVGCHDLTVEFENKVPTADTGRCHSVGSTSVALTGYCDGITLDGGVACFQVSDDPDFRRLTNVWVEITEEHISGAEDITAVVTNLIPNKQYYYKFGILHGYVRNHQVELLSEASVWGDVKTFKTDVQVPEIKTLSCENYRYDYDSSKSIDQVQYNLVLTLDVPLNYYIDEEYIDNLSIYMVAEDESFDEYITDLAVSDSRTEVSFVATVPKSAFAISVSQDYCSASTSAFVLGLIDKDMEVITASGYTAFNYTRQPKITLVSVEQSEAEVGDFSEGTHNWDRRTMYKPVMKSDGALFYDSFCSYATGSWVSEGLGSSWNRWWDGEVYWPNGIKLTYYSSSSSHTSYISYVSTVADYYIVSDNSICFYFDGNGNVSIYISDYVPEITKVSAKSAVTGGMYDCKPTDIDEMGFSSVVGLEKNVVYDASHQTMTFESRDEIDSINLKPIK